MSSDVSTHLNITKTLDGQYSTMISSVVLINNYFKKTGSQII